MFYKHLQIGRVSRSRHHRWGWFGKWCCGWVAVAGPLFALYHVPHQEQK